MNDELKEALRDIIREELAPMKKDLNQFRGEFLGFKDQTEGKFEETNKNLEAFQEEFQEFKDQTEKDLRELKPVNKNLKAFQNEFREFRDQTHADLQVIKGGQQGIRAEVTDKTNEVKTAIRDLRSDVEYTFHKTAQNELEMRRLKKW